MKLYTVAAVARWLNLTERRVRQLKDKGVITEYRPGLYDLQAANHQYINYLRKSNPDTEEQVDYNTERAKLVRAKRENEELELQLRKNEIHYSEEVERIITDMLIRFKTRLMAIPAKQSPVLAKKDNQTEIFKLLKGAINEALEELADFQNLFKEDNGNGDDKGEH
jgi:predicted NAD/FAD-dependent oxidoreductase